ncbi:MAG: helix-turn-helix domain-containing protein [Desulfobacteraceae bacterium]|nr:helix-turn-helix domain-containing protein [Desulfobacteraceae bacterium]
MGCNSYIDLSVYLIERYCGSRTAMECSKAMIHDFGRDSQAPYTVFQRSRDHQDKNIAAVQEFMEKNSEESFQPEMLAKKYGMSRRTFERHFKNATGHTPLHYLQQIRVEKAKLQLETSTYSFDEIAYETGYEDSGFFRKIFKKHTGLLPSQYRSRFQR